MEWGVRKWRMHICVCAFLRSLYLLRRGPMLAPILQHADDIDYVRCLFLNSNLEDSLRLINPPLYLARQGKVRSNPLERRDAGRST